MRFSLLMPLAALAAAGFPLLASAPAAAGGTAVVAPETLGAEDCEQGVHPRILGFRKEVAPKVIGCARLSDGDEVLVAADWDGHRACFYATLAGDQHVDGPCVGLGTGTPLARGPVVDGLAVRKPDGGSGAFIGGLVSSDVAHAFLRYRTENGGTREWPAASIRVGEPLAEQLGATRSFAYFVGEIPADADPCRRLVVEGRGDAAELMASERLNEWTAFADGISLSGAKGCERAETEGRGALDRLRGAGSGLHVVGTQPRATKAARG